MPDYYGASPEEIFAREQQSRNGMDSNEESKRQQLIANLMKAGNMDLARDVASGPYQAQDTGSTMSSQEAWSRTPNSSSIADVVRGPYGDSSYPPSQTGPIVHTPTSRPSEAGGFGAGNMPYNQTQAYWDDQFKNDPQVRARQQGAGAMNQPQSQAPVINIHVGGAGSQQPATDQGPSPWDQWREFMKNSGPSHPPYDQSTPTYGQSGDMFSPLPNLQWPQQQGPQGQMSQGQPAAAGSGPPSMGGPRYNFPVQGSAQPGYIQDAQQMARDRGSYVPPIVTSPNSPYAGVVNGAQQPQQAPWYNQFLEQFQKYLYSGAQGAPPAGNNMYSQPGSGGIYGNQNATPGIYGNR